MGYVVFGAVVKACGKPQTPFQSLLQIIWAGKIYGTLFQMPGCTLMFVSIILGNTKKDQTAILVC